MDKGLDNIAKKKKKVVVVSSSQEKILFWRARILTLSTILVDHIKTFGFCVIDNFLGSTLSSHVLNDVTSQNTTTESEGIKRFLMILDCVIKQSGRTGLDVLGSGGKRRPLRVNYPW